MNKHLYLLLLFLPALCFAQQSETKLKTIRGFVFENTYLADTLVPATILSIKIKGTDRSTTIDEDGKFEIEAQEGELLVIKGSNETREILITDKNCYKIDLQINLTDDYLFTKKDIRRTKRYFRKLKSRIQNNIKNDFYDCND